MPLSTSVPWGVPGTKVPLGSRSSGAQIPWEPRYLGTWGWMALRNKKSVQKVQKRQGRKEVKHTEVCQLILPQASLFDHSQKKIQTCIIKLKNEINVKLKKRTYLMRLHFKLIDMLLCFLVQIASQ